MEGAHCCINSECGVNSEETKREKCQQFSRMLCNWNAKVSVCRAIGVLFCRLRQVLGLPLKCNFV